MAALLDTYERQRTEEPDPAEIHRLIDQLASHNGRERMEARHELAALGRHAVSPLTEALRSPDRYLRWEAAKALGQIADPSAAPALVEALEDRVFSIRWLAGQGLVAIGPEGLPPLLERLIVNPESLWLRQGAYHVLKRLVEKGEGEVVRPVLKALHGIYPEIQVMHTAGRALEALRRGPPRRRRVWGGERRGA